MVPITDKNTFFMSYWFFFILYYGYILASQKKYHNHFVMPLKLAAIKTFLQHFDFPLLLQDIQGEFFHFFGEQTDGFTSFHAFLFNICGTGHIRQVTVNTDKPLQLRE